MSNFITEANTELEHVVWPTPAENKKYMMYTVGVIVVLGIFLAVLGYSITNGLKLARDQFPHDVAPTATVSGEDTMSQADLDKLLKNIQVQTGATASGSKTGTGK
ncbi:preprotein translocase subunit SecE [Candidatus Gracilibacteria bacterium]|nr:preprotein translocase subunit SecE [Candidatus Gracilibacteria bacterium]